MLNRPSGGSKEGARRPPAGCCVLERFGKDIVEIGYDTRRYPFREIIGEALRAHGIIQDDIPLEELHRTLAPESKRQDDYGINAVSQALYEPGERFERTYRAFAREILAAQIFKSDLVFQKTPTFRVKMPLLPGERDELYPQFHTDIGLGHPPESVNVWIPLTRAECSKDFVIVPLEQSLALYDSFAMPFAEMPVQLDRIDSGCLERCLAAGRPATIGYGQMIIFDSRCIHSPLPSYGDLTRLSLDVRVIPRHQYDKMGYHRGKGRRRAEFRRGDYYDAELASAAPVHAASKSL